jgi:hypothetical protein
MLGSAEQVLIVGVDFAESILRSAGEMDGVRSAKKHRRRKNSECLINPIDDGRRYRQPMVCIVGAIQIELVQYLAKCRGREDVFADLTMKARNDFGVAMQAAGNRSSSGKRSYLFISRIFDVESEDIADVEINHSTDRSRSSDTMRVLLVPPRSLPLFVSLRKAAVSLRTAK